MTKPNPTNIHVCSAKAVALSLGLCEENLDDLIDRCLPRLSPESMSTTTRSGELVYTVTCTDWDAQIFRID